MKPSEVEDFAREYIEGALEVQRRLGDAGSVSTEEYDAAVSRAAGAFQELLSAGNGRRRVRDPLPSSSG
jgi:hypothetical protein